MNRKRPLSAMEHSPTPFSIRRWLCFCAALAFVFPNVPATVAFGIVSTNIRGKIKTSLSVSTLAPPPHHLAWLQSQEERERRMRKQKLLGRKRRTQQHKDVLPSTMFLAQETMNGCNETAKEAWAASFTTVEALRDTFGRNRNGFWGDLDPRTTRRLYKTLLPRALLELYHCHGASSEDLAPLAYRARVAAKKYARERCRLPGRIGAALFDGFRQFCKYGTFQATGMSYPQLWEKYATQIQQQEEFDNEQDLTSAVCYKILEKSCETNARVDTLFLSRESTQQDLQEITRKLEQDVYDLVRDPPTKDRKRWAIRRYKILRTLLRIRKQMEGLAYTDRDDDIAMKAVLEDAVRG